MTGSKTDITGDHVDDLKDSIDGLAEQVRVLRDVLDELREDYSWALRNDAFRNQPTCPVLKRMPLDPTDPIWAAGVDIARGRPASAESDEASGQGAPSVQELDRLWHNVELTLSSIASDQLEQMLAALDDFRAALMRSRGANVELPESCTPQPMPVEPRPVQESGAVVPKQSESMDDEAGNGGGSGQGTLF